MSATLPAINLQFGQDAFFYQDVINHAGFLGTSIVIAENPDRTDPRRHFR
jgi:hypothetical protein